MGFIVDAQLPPALARWLVTKGHFANHVADLHMQDAADAVIWNHALQQNAALITKDEDFARMHLMVGNGPAVIWIRLRTRGGETSSHGSRPHSP